ncbi:FkbM family methyltransferase [Saccharothrix sp. 6-C]|uniref:FkbM family methyltransferase n=1 Tax=Saccharothrix sp. 6-C TaxID=2781735 RepID=UPI001917166E|nr:FkbM family methyltransferase [Saccharothrix sp. 6-C]QQQ76523.1 FkbM family methyltransferase [Saccharothrix sp. 6-C]
MADPRTAGGAVTACTVVARNYLPAARVLAASYLEHHPDHEFVIAVIDAPRGSGERQGRLRTVGPEASGIDADDYLRMATAYNITELATAVKPYLLRELRADADVVIYLDPDIQVFAPMPELAELALAHGIVLTPHFLHPLPRDGKDPSEAAIMGAGIFNLGFVATGPGAGPFLDFWAERLRHDAIVAPEKQLFTDQRWVDQVPALFGNTVLRDPGFNVAYWNIHERPVERGADGVLTAGGHRLRFFHYSGYRPEKPWLLSHHTPNRPRVVLSEHPTVRELCDGYRAALQGNGYAETLESIPYGFAKMADGTKISPAMRTLYRDAWVKAERGHLMGLTGNQTTEVPPHAFDADGGEALRRWLAGPPDDAPVGTTLSRLVHAVWESRPDLKTAFPLLHSRDAAPFRSWCASSGVTEASLPAWALPAEPVEPSEPSDEFGVNVVGYLTAELGVGEMARLVHDAIRESGVPVVSVVEDRLVSNRTGLAEPGTVGRPRFPISLLCVNADQTRAVLDHQPHVGHHRYRIGLWAWELEEFPGEMHHAFDLVDEVWTVSEFCRDAIAKHTSVPVKAIPVPVRDPGAVSRPERRPGDPVQFLFAFDFFSIGQRKNPWGLVEAFQRAFEGRDDVRLVLKAINGDKNPHTAERLRVKVMDDPRIELVERYLSVRELDDLYASSSAYVSLHRSEGFGLTVAEAMARAMPVISTDYSSTAEFLDAKTGWPVPAKLVPVGPGHHPYPAGAVWAEPDLDAAARAMREVADNPAEAARRGRAAREHILRTRSVKRAATWMAEQLRAAHESWQGSGGAGYRAELPGADLLRPLRESKQALLWRAEVGAASRTPLAPALRKAVLRAIDHYDVHQRKVMGTLVGGVEDTLNSVVARLEAVESNVESTRWANEGLKNRLASAQDEFRAAAEDNAANLTNLEQQLDNTLERVWTRLADDERTTFTRFAERDERLDGDEQRITELARTLSAVQDTARLRHAPVPAGADVVVCDAGALLLPVDNVVLPWLAYHRSWEVEEADLMAGLVGDGTFLDIGAHVGYHTLRLLQRAKGVASVVAVEANPVNAEYLRRNVVANLGAEGARTVDVLPVAAWDEDGSIRLVQAEDDNSGDHRAHELSDEGTGGVVIPAIRLDGRAEVTDRRVTLVKVDLQGRDHRALAGLTAVLERDRPHVVCEFCPSAIVELGDDPLQVLLGYRKMGYAPVPLGADPDAEHADEDLVRQADTVDTGFVTLWLRPL